MKDKIRFCEVCGKEGTSKNIWKYKDKMFLCHKHRGQIIRHGRFLERTSKDLNEIVITNDHAEIILYNRYQKEKARALISLDKVTLVEQYRWNFSSSNGYVTSGCGKGQLLLHRVVINAKDGEIVDHINRDRLDCRNDNLRISTKSQNSANGSIRRNNTSGVIGVWFNKLNSKWVAELKINGVKQYLGAYSKKEDAIKARFDGEIKYFGEFSPQAKEVKKSA